MGIGSADTTKPTMPMSVLQEEVLRMLDRQMEEWDLAARNYEALNHVLTHEVLLGDTTIRVQYNPARSVSTAAKVDKESIKQRPCFLCQDHLPSEQLRLSFGDRYLILCNPYPIFRRHLTIPACEHVPQCIQSRLADMLELSRHLPDFTLFYNGPRCGASAPDHLHFQAASWGDMPVDREVESHIKPLLEDKEACLYTLHLGSRNGFVIRSSSISAITQMFEKICLWLPVPAVGEEPMMNLFVHYEKQGWKVVMFVRKSHRPWQYAAAEPEHFLSSPGAADLGGVFITVREADFHRADAAVINDIYQQVCFSIEEVEMQMEKKIGK